MNTQVTVHVRKVYRTNENGFFREISYRDQRGFVRIAYATGAKAAAKVIRAASPAAVVAVS